MKRITIIALILSCLGFSSCMLVTDMATEMYWNLDAPAPVDPDSALDTLCIIKYTIEGTTRQTAIHNQSELDRLLYALLDESKKSPCSLFQSNHSSGAAPLSAVKELPVVKFSSADVNKVKEWAKRMLLKGYQVEIIYDKRGRTYNCTAHSPAK